MSSATASLPNLQNAGNASVNAQSGLNGLLAVVGGLTGNGDGSPLRAVQDAVSGLDALLNIDVSGLSQRLPATLSDIEQALPSDAIRFVEEIRNHYQEVVDFLQNSELVRQIRPGSSLEQTALALVDDLLDVFGQRIAGLGNSLIDAQTLTSVRDALQTIEALAAGTPLPAGELLEFIAHNLLGVAPDLLSEARNRLASALQVAAPFSATALGAALSATQNSLTTAFQQLAQELQAFDASDAAAYGALEGRLTAYSAALDAALRALETLYATLATAVARPEWDALFAGYAAALHTVPLPAVPTVDDAVDALAGAVETLLTRLGMSLSPADLAAQVERMSASIHDLFAASPLAQVRQILIDFIDSIARRLDGIPLDEVRDAVEGMLHSVSTQINQLGIGQVRTTMQQAFQAANQFVDENIGNDLLLEVNAQLGTLLSQLQNVPLAAVGQELSDAIDDAAQVIADLQQSIADGLDEVRNLLASLDGIDFRPVADEVIDEISALKTKLQAIRPDSLSDAERIAIQAGLSLLRALDVQGRIEGELKVGFASVDDQLIGIVQTILDAWLEFRRRIGTLDGSSLAAPVTALLEQVTDSVLKVNGTLLLAPLDELLGQLLARLQTLSPAALLDPLQAPYQRMLQTIEQANPAVWVEPLRLLHGELDRLIDAIDVTPLFDQLEARQRQLFGQARQAIIAALDAVSLPQPLDVFYGQMKAIALALSDAVFAEPDTALRALNVTLATSVRPSMLFAPLDQVFDRLLATIDALPAGDVLAALEALRQGLGSALPALAPANVVAGLREAQGRVAALAPATLPGVVAMPAMRVRLAAQLELSPDLPAAKASLLTRFDLALTPLLPADGSRLQQVNTAHSALVAALRRRINSLDSSAAQIEYQRVQAGLARLLPAFLQQAQPLQIDDLRAGLASLRPSTRARRLDLAVERFLGQVAPLQGALEGAVDGFFGEIRQATLTLHPASLKDAVAEIYTVLRNKLALLDPDDLASSLRSSIWEPLLDPLHALDPAVLKAELHALFTNLLNKVRSALQGLLTQLKVALDAFLTQVRQALTAALRTLGEAIESILERVGELLAQVDQLLVDDLFERLLTLLANLKISFNLELDRVGNEFEAMLAAIPLSGSAEVSIG